MNRIAAIRNGIKYLHDRVLSGEYSLGCVGLDGQPKYSDQRGHLFSVFFIVQALDRDMSEVERTIFLMRILSEEQLGEWGYSPRGYYKEEGYNPFFTDADDTAFALRTLRALQIYRTNNPLLKFYSDQAQPSGFCTFYTEKPQALVLTTLPCFENNFQLHPEVNANVYHSLLDTHADTYINYDLIAASQRSDGSWPAYFYPNVYYGTWQAMSLLKQTNQLRMCFERGLQFVIDTQLADGSWGGDVYTTALAMLVLCLDGTSTFALEKGAVYLVEQHNAWRTEQVIWQFYDAEGDVWRAYDTHGVIAAATCLAALKSYTKLMDKK